MIEYTLSSDAPTALVLAWTGYSTIVVFESIEQWREWHKAAPQGGEEAR